MLSASSTVSGFSDDNLSFTFTGAPDLESLTDVLTLTVFGGTDFSGQISTEQLSQILDFSAIANSAVVEAAFTNDGLVFRLGNSASLPEPTSWALLLLGVGLGLFVQKHGTKRKTK